MIFSLIPPPQVAPTPDYLTGLLLEGQQGNTRKYMFGMLKCFWGGWEGSGNLAKNLCRFCVEKSYTSCQDAVFLVLSLFLVHLSWTGGDWIRF